MGALKMLTAEELRQTRELDEHSNYYSIAWAITIPNRDVRAENLPPKVTSIPLNEHFPRYADTYRASLNEHTLRTILQLRKRANDPASRDLDLEEHPLDYYRRTAQRSDSRTITLDAALNKTISKRCIEAWFPIDRQDREHPSILLNPYDRHIIQQTPALQKTAVFHLLIMLELYGFNCTFDAIEERPFEERPFEDRITIAAIDGIDKTHWIQNDSPHYADITRILRSLCLLGLQNYARAFFAGLDALYGHTQQHFLTMMPDSNRAAWQGAIGNVPELRQITITALDTNTISAANTLGKWINIITSLQTYHAKLSEPGVSHALFSDRNNAKLDAVLNLLTTLIGCSVSHDGVSSITPTDHISSSTGDATAKLFHRISDAAAIARGYISTDGEATKALIHSTLYEKLIIIINTQKDLVSRGMTESELNPVLRRR